MENKAYDLKANGVHLQQNVNYLYTRFKRHNLFYTVTVILNSYYTQCYLISGLSEHSTKTLIQNKLHIT